MEQRNPIFSENPPPSSVLEFDDGRFLPESKPLSSILRSDFRRRP